MIAGRNYRRMISQNVAFLAFRFLAVWVILVVCASKGQPGQAAALVIIVIDLVSGGVYRGLVMALENQSRKDWLDRLTNRFFYGLLWEELRSGRSQSADIDELFREATKQAAADIELADKRDPTNLDSKKWHWFGGVLHFISQAVSMFLYYGSAMLVGSHNG